MMLASLETQSGLAPGSHRTGVTNRCAALATTVGMVAGVHYNTTNGRSPTHVALLTGFTDFNIVVIKV